MRRLFVIVLWGLIVFPQFVVGQILSTTFFKVTPGDSFYVAFFADGNIRGIASTSNDKQAIGTGALGINVQRGNVSWSAVVNVASSIDTLKNCFGAHLLNPTTGKSLAGYLDIRINSFCELFGNKFGLHSYLGTSKSNWIFRDEMFNAVTSGFGLMLYNDIINAELNENEISFGIELGLALRWIAGDIADDSNESHREKLVGTTTKHFPGFEGGMQIQFGSIIAGIQGYWLFDLAKSDFVPGLSRGQISAGFSISGPIFQGYFKKKK